MRRGGSVLAILALVGFGMVAATAQPDGEAVAVQRLAGPDRFATAVEVSQATFPNGAERVFLATGEAFADALAGGGASRGASPVLLTGQSALPAVTAAELARLDPDEVVVLGGVAAVSQDVGSAAAVAAGSAVRRLGGATRVETAVEVSRWAFPGGAEEVYVATGDGFPDALSGGVAAGLTGGPVLLVAGGVLPPATLDELRRLAPARVTVLGGEGAVPAAVAQGLADVAPVRRLAGPSRYATAVAVSSATFPQAEVVFVATAGSFADALSGAPAAIAAPGPLLLVDGPGAVFASAPDVTLDEVSRLGPDRIVVLGGPSVVDDPTVGQLVEAAASGPSDDPTVPVGGETPTPTETPTSSEPPATGGGGTGGGGDDDGGQLPVDDPPEFPDGAVLTVADVGSAEVTVAWPAATDDGAVVGYDVLVDGVVDHTVGAGVLQATVTGLAASTQYTISVVAIDDGGNRSAPLSMEVTTDDPPPVDGDAPPVPPAGFSSTAESTAFMQTRQNADQGAVEPQRAGALSGRVVDTAGQPIVGVEVQVLGVPELGQVTTDEEGRWDLAVNGGGAVTVDFADPTGVLLPVQRTVEVGWQEWLAVEDVVMLALDPNETAIDLTDDSGIQVARGSVVTDDAGTRQGTLLVPPGAQASSRFDDGSSQQVNDLDVRITEYTVGPDGPARMPAGLPATSGYTYAFELTAQQALDAGADGVDFTGDLPLFYAENFVGAPVGTVVPFATYDFDDGRWEAEPNGRVVQILGEQGSTGRARVDTSGDGAADNGTTLPTPMTDAEREVLWGLYGVQAPVTLQRIPITSFSPKDPNFPTQTEGDEVGPEQDETDIGDPDDGEEPPEESRPDDTTEDFGTISALSQRLVERIDLVGVPADLVYTSEAVAGRRQQVPVTVLGQNTAPASLLRIDVTLTVAGRTITESLQPGDLAAGDTTEVVMEWDGRDVFGRELYGQQAAVLDIAYHYPLVYLAPISDREAPEFGLYPNPDGEGFVRPGPDGNPLTRELASTRRLTLNAGSSRFDADLGGWALDVHHLYDPVGGILVTGDGRRRVTSVVRTASTLVGPVMDCDSGHGEAPEDCGHYVGPTVPGQPADTEILRDVKDLDVLADGTLLIGQTATDVTRRPPHVVALSTDGSTLDVLVTDADCGDHGPGDTSQTCRAASIEPGPDGSVWVGYELGRLVRYDANGQVLEEIQVAEGPGFGDVSAIEVGPDGSLLLLDNDEGRLSQLPPGGDTPVVIAGQGAGCGAQTTCSAADLNFDPQAPRDLAVDEQGRAYVAIVEPAGGEGEPDNGILWRIDPDGTATRVAGLPDGDPNESTPAAGDVAHQTYLPSVESVVVRTDGSVLIAVGSYVEQIFSITRGILGGVAGRGQQTCADGGGAAPSFAQIVIGGEVAAHCREGAAALQLRTEFVPAMQTMPDGRLVLSDLVDQALRQIDRPYPGYSASNIVIPSADGSMLYEFDDAARHIATRSTTTGGELIRFDYDDGTLSAVTFVNGEVDGSNPPDGEEDNVLTIDRNGEDITLTGPFGDDTTLTVDDQGLLETVTNPAGETTTLDHDADGLLRSITGPIDQTTYRFTYDGLGRITSAVDPVQGETTYTRADLDDGWQVAVETPEGLVTTHEVVRDDTFELVQRRTDPDGTVTETRQLPDGTLQVTDPTGTITETQSAPDPRFGWVSGYATRLVTRTPAGIQRVTTSTREVDDPGAPTELSLASEVNGETTIEATVDLTDGSSQTTDGSGVATSVTVDLQGRPATSQVGDDEPVDFTYDRGRLVEVAQDGRTATYTYSDGAGDTAFLQGSTNAEAEQTTYTRDPAGRTTSVTDDEAQTTAFAYDAGGNLVGLTPPGQSEHEQAFDLLDRLGSYAPPETGGDPDQVTWSYDGDSRVATISRPDSDDLQQVYDGATGAGRLTERSVGGNGTTTFTYDAAGRLTGVDGPDGDLSYTYDGSLVTQVSQTRGGVGTDVVLTYDNRLRVDSLTIGGLGPVEYDYDANSRPTGIGATTATYDADGRLGSTSIGTVDTTYSYNGRGELTRIQASTDDFTTTIFDQQLTRDDAGRVTDVLETVNSTTRAITYTYDDAGRLVQATHDDGDNGSVEATFDYTYDANGNRLTGPQGAIHTYDARDRIADANYSHDGAGDLTATPDGPVDYDAAGNLLSARNGAVTYGVDGLDRRVTRTEGTDTVGWMYAGGSRPIAEVDPADGTVTARFINGPRGIDHVIGDAATHAIVTDHTGSPRLAIDIDDGSVDHTVDYSPFGVILSETGDAAIHPFRFQGGLADPLTGWVRFGARDYDPTLGRFTTRDPILFAGGQANLYEYAASDPINRRDPSGTGPSDDGDGGSDGGGGGQCRRPVPVGWVVDIDGSATIRRGGLGEGVTYTADDFPEWPDRLDLYEGDVVMVEGMNGVRLQSLDGYAGLDGWHPAAEYIEGIRVSGEPLRGRFEYVENGSPPFVDPDLFSKGLGGGEDSPEGHMCFRVGIEG